MSHSTARETMDTLHQTANQLGANACGVMRNAQDTASDWTQKAQENLESLANATSDYVEQGQKKAQELGRTVTDKVHERPLAALLAAAGAGFLLGVILKRR